MPDARAGVTVAPASPVRRRCAAVRPAGDPGPRAGADRACGRAVSRSDQQLEAELDDLTQRAVDAETRLAEAERQRDAAQADHERRTADDDDRLGRLQTQLEELPASEIPVIEPDELERQAPLTLVAPITGGAPSEAEPVHTATAFERHGSPTAADASWHGIGPSCTGR